MLWHVRLSLVLLFSQLYCTTFWLFCSMWALMLSSLSLYVPREWNLHCSALSGPFATTGIYIYMYSLEEGPQIWRSVRFSAQLFRCPLIAQNVLHFSALSWAQFAVRKNLVLVIVCFSFLKFYGSDAYQKNDDLGSPGDILTAFGCHRRGEYHTKRPIVFQRWLRGITYQKIPNPRGAQGLLFGFNFEVFSGNNRNKQKQCWNLSRFRRDLHFHTFFYDFGSPKPWKNDGLEKGEPSRNMVNNNVS